MSAKARTEADERELRILLEAARRANWEALHGPPHLRTGRYDPRNTTAEVVADSAPDDRAAE